MRFYLKESMKTFVFLSVLSLLVPTLSYSQTDEIEESAEEVKNGAKKVYDGAKENYKKGKKYLKKKMPKKRKKTLYERAKDAAVDNLFPEWPVPEFSLGFDPIAGFEARSYTSGGVTQEVVKSELGLHGHMKAIPFDPNNPGFVGHANLGGAFGAQGEGTTESDGATSDVDGLTYKRFWGAFGLSFLYKHYKDTITIRRGLLDPSNDSDSITSFGVTNDLSVLIYSWVSAHWTLDYDKFHLSSQDEAFLTESNHWIHTRVFTTKLNAYFDIGPGFTDSEQNLGGMVKKQFTTYFLANAGFNPFWKLVAKARAKYVLGSSGETIDSSAAQLPDQALNEPIDSGIPSDSLVASAFAGFDNIWGGFGFGYQINLTILNVNETGDTQKSVTRQQGLTLAYTAHY